MEPLIGVRKVLAPLAGTGWRLALSVWLVYCLFATTNIVRETYLAIALGESGSVKVDRYQNLHPDLFEIPGRGWYINSNPGASMVGALGSMAVYAPLIPGLVEHMRSAAPAEAAKVATGWWAIAEALRQMLAGPGVPAAVATGAVAAIGAWRLWREPRHSLRFSWRPHS